MNDTKSRVLLIEDDKIDQMAFERLVKNEHLSYDYTIAGSVFETKNILNSEQFDFIIADYLLGDGTVFDLFDCIKDIPVIFVTGCGNEEAAVKAMKAGAYDYLIKDPDYNYLRMLPLVAENAIKHKNAEKQFRMLSHAMMNIRDSVYITDINNHILFVNKAFSETYGYQEEEIIGLTIHCIYENNCIENNIHSNYQGEFNHKRKDGSIFPVFLSSSVIPNGNGNPFAIVAITRDITEQKQMEKEIEKRKKYLESVLYAAPDAIITINTSHCIVEWNPGAEQIFGYTRYEILGKNIDDLVTCPSLKKEAVILTRKVLSGEKVHPFETVRFRKDSSAIDVIVAASPFQIGDNLQGAVIIYTDISKRKQAENELRRVNRALKTLSESNQILVRATNEQDLLDNVCRILVDEGGYCFAWIGYTEESKDKSVKPISKSGREDGYLDAVHFTWDNQPQNSNPISKSIWAGEPCITKNLSKTSDPDIWCIEAVKRHYASSMSLPLLNQDISFGTLTIYSEEQNAFDFEEVNLLKELAEDLAFGIMVLRARIAHKKTEQENNKIQMQLLQAQKMESIGIMAGGIAHDFNNLLTAIIGCVDLALDEVDKTDIVHGDLREIQMAAQRAADLTKQLLLFSRKKPMKFISVNMNCIIKDLLMMLKRLIGEDIEIITHLAPNLWTIKADQGTLEQVIMNLAVNARDAMPNGGELTIKTENIILTEKDYKRMSEVPLGKCIRISVSDKGIGMDEKTIQHIYDPFFSTKAIGKGTGLGLSVVYGIVKQHGGCMHVESKINYGTTFEVYLPAINKKKEEKTKGMIPTKKYQGENKRILVVEDEEKVREFTISGLNRSGYVAIGAANAREAMDIFKRENGNFHVIISDIVLPGKSGIELVDGFCAQKPDIGILLSSGYTDHQSRWPIIQERGYRFLEKPYALNDLLQIIQEIVS
ncbi:PAS domain S-box protein [bacterium]|nr:PAS domain S-box protein [bacterium]